MGKGLYFEMIMQFCLPAPQGPSTHKVLKNSFLDNEHISQVFTWTDS